MGGRSTRAAFPQKSHYFLALILVTCISIYYYVTFGPKNRHWFAEEVKSNGSIQYLIDTPGCRIPETEIFYPGFYRKVSRDPDCLRARKVAVLNDDEQMLTIHDEFKSYECFISEVTGNGGNDSLFRISKPEKIGLDVDISQKELILTRCGNYYNLDANFPMKPEVEKKIEYWENKKGKTPFSVLFFGFDSCSRSHFHRNLPKSMELIKDLEFLDFQGYHSVAPYTLENFLGFLVGMETPTVRKKCASDWQSTFDDCPLLWKYYSENNFVTMYAEDGSQTFNWGGQGGFSHRPTDYYTHPLFNSRSSLRKQYPLFWVSDLCMSDLNPQRFLLDYIRRFVRKFQDTPFFSFTWINDATHDDTGALAGVDEDLAVLLESLKSSPETLERTIIIILSDHGTRFGDVTNIEKPGAFLERSLPGLFMRVPKLLYNRFPDEDLKLSLEQNTKRLTTGFDIYHTLKHLLILNGMEFTENIGDTHANGSSRKEKISVANFPIALTDRSSLLVPLSESRSCADANIRSANCVCNTTSEVHAWDNPYLRSKLIGFAFKELNNVISSSKYAFDCVKYTTPMMTFVSATIVRNSTEQTDGVMRFIADPGATIFEVNLRVVHQSSIMDEVLRLSNFIRISKYGEKSWCVGFETDEDKMLKEVCTCRHQKPK